MGKVSIIVPELTINKVLNPSAEAAGNFANYNGGAVAQQVTVPNAFDIVALYGTYFYHITTAGANSGASFTLDTLDNAIHFVTLRSEQPIAAAFSAEVSADGANWHVIADATIEPIENGGPGTWVTYGVAIPAVQCNGSTTLYVRFPVGFGARFDLDGLQVEEKEYWTTYTDGDQTGSEWLPGGLPHATPSQRSAQSAAGGRVINLDDYNVSVDIVAGAGYAPIRHNVLPFALLPGASMRNEKVRPRPLTLRCHTTTESEATQYDARKAIIDAIKSDRVAVLQPVQVRFRGDTLYDVTIGAYYSDGMQGMYDTTCYDEFDIVLIAYDPMWSAIVGSSTELDVSDAFGALNYIAGRVDGAWDDLSVGAGGSSVYKIVIGPDGNIYVGGSFATIDGVANTSRIAMFNPSTRVWTPLNDGATDGVIHAMAFGPGTTLYVGGSFTSMDNGGGPVANTRAIARWQGGNWVAMGTGATAGSVWAIAIGHGRAVFAGGNFTGMGGLPGTTGDYIARWSVGAWASISPNVVGCVPEVTALAVGLDNSLYVGGNYTTIGGIAVNSIARKDPAGTWYAMDGGESGGCNYVNAIAIAPNGRVVIAGDFTDMGSSDISFIAEWTGATWIALGDGVNGTVNDLTFGPDGTLYVCGLFTTAGGLTLSDGLVRWNGYSWGYLDIDMGGGFIIRTIAIGHPDPVVGSNYDVYIGFNSNPASVVAGSETVNNTGTRTAYPRFTITNESAVNVTLKTLRNETAGTELLFDYTLIAGETLTVDLTPGNTTVTSDFRGQVFSAVLRGSDLAQWALIPGENEITCFCEPSTDIEAFLIWEDQHYDPAGAQ